MFLQSDNKISVKPIAGAFLAAARTRAGYKLTRFFVPLFFVISHAFSLGGQVASALHRRRYFPKEVCGEPHPSAR